MKDCPSRNLLHGREMQHMYERLTCRWFETDCVNVGSPSNLEEPEVNRQRTTGPAAAKLQKPGRADRKERLSRRLMEWASEAEMVARQGYEKSDPIEKPAGRGRNGKSKMLKGDFGEMEIVSPATGKPPSNSSS